MKITRCIHQVFRPTGPNIPLNKGDCKICTYDENNQNCPGFYPITIIDNNKPS